MRQQLDVVAMRLSEVDEGRAAYACGSFRDLLLERLEDDDEEDFDDDDDDVSSSIDLNCENRLNVGKPAL